MSHRTANTPEYPLISVIMPCYNAARFVEESVASIFGQTYPNFELIVIDDGSDDDSVAILHSLIQRRAGHIQLLHQDHRGPYPARNLGLRHARGDFVAFLDADDYWRNDFLEKMHAKLIRYNMDWVYCGWQNFGNFTRNTQPYIPSKYENGDMAAEFLRSCPWPIHAALIKRSVINTVGGFSERRFTSMDYDLWLRIFAVTRKMLLVPEVMAFYRWHGNQISKKVWIQVMDAYFVRKDFIDNYPDQVSHIGQSGLVDLTDGYILRMAYRAYWDRDLFTAKQLFRYSLPRHAWKRADLKYIILSLFPLTLFRLVIASVDRFRGGGTA